MEAYKIISEEVKECPFCGETKILYSVSKANAIDEILEDEQADVEEVKHGEWLLEREPNGKPYCLHCSVCDSDFGRISIVSATPFCPWCGAKMDVKGE